MKRFKVSLGHAVKGLRYVFKSEANFRIHFVIMLMVFLLAFILRCTKTEWCILIICVFMVLITEIFNTSIERVVDLVEKKYDTLAKYAKDLAAAAVLLTAIGAVVIGIIIFGGKILEVIL